MPRAQVTGELEDSSSSHTCQRSDAIITIIDTELLPVEREENPNALSLSLDRGIWQPSLETNGFPSDLSTVASLVYSMISCLTRDLVLEGEMKEQQ